MEITFYVVMLDKLERYNSHGTQPRDEEEKEKEFFPKNRCAVFKTPP